MRLPPPFQNVVMFIERRQQRLSRCGCCFALSCRASGPLLWRSMGKDDSPFFFFFFPHFKCPSVSRRGFVSEMASSLKTSVRCGRLFGGCSVTPAGIEPSTLSGPGLETGTRPKSHALICDPRICLKTNTPSPPPSAAAASIYSILRTSSCTRVKFFHLGVCYKVESVRLQR